MPLCNQCGKKPAIYLVGNNPLCMDCYTKLQQTVIQGIPYLQAEINYLTDSIESITGTYGVLPRYKIPQPITTQSALTFNNINVDRSVIGVINTAEVKQIDITMSKIKNSGNEELTKAVKEFTEAVISETKLNNDTKNQIIELISFLTKQSLLNKEKRQNSIIKAVLTHVESLISTIALLLPLWTKLRPLLNL